jgi:hypothetical protein
VPHVYLAVNYLAVGKLPAQLDAQTQQWANGKLMSLDSRITIQNGEFRSHFNRYSISYFGVLCLHDNQSLRPRSDYEALPPQKMAYDGDLYHRSGAKALSETVNTYPSITTVTSNPNPSMFGQAVVITATVTSSGPTPTGTVTFRNDTLMLGSAALSGGTASINKTNLPAGTNSINVTYHGDTQTAVSIGSTTQTVN